MPVTERFCQRSLATRNLKLLTVVCLLALTGCDALKKKPIPYGRETPLILPAEQPQIWGIAPAVNLSGQSGVDALIQADLLYQQLQAVKGLTVVPVDRVVAVYQALRIAQVQSEDQARAVCDALGLDGLLVPTVTAYDPYNPPKFAVALQLFEPKHHDESAAIDVRKLASEAAPAPGANEPRHVKFRQVVGTYDAANGSVRDSVLAYAKGRFSPGSPLGSDEYFENMDRYCGFVYHDLIRKLFIQLSLP